MPFRAFLIALAVVSAASGSALLGLGFLIPELRVHWKFSIATVFAFAAVCTALYLIGLKTARSKNRHAFNGVISVSVMGKMVFALLFLFIYKKTAQPPNTAFVGIFLFCYVVYTVYEVWFMTKLAKLRAD
jgi:hypothetical protein